MARILMVDDDPDICFVLKKLLERHGHEVLAALNGREALERLASAPCDVVITDMIMPEMDGVELIMKMREDYPLMKVIAISGGGRISAEEYLKMAKTLKVSRTFQKPIKSADLIAAVDDLLATAA